MEIATAGRKGFAELLQQFREGDSAATAELLRRYTPALREAVRRRLPQRMRGEFESLDFVQEVWAALCAAPDRNVSFRTTTDLQAYLVRIAASRVIDAFRRRSRRSSFTGVPERQLSVATIGAEPTPSQWAMADERWQSIASTLSGPQVAVIDGLRQGFTQQEIADRTGISLRVISRIVQSVKRKCEGNPA